MLLPLSVRCASVVLTVSSSSLVRLDNVKIRRWKLLGR